MVVFLFVVLFLVSQNKATRATTIDSNYQIPVSSSVIGMRVAAVSTLKTIRFMFTVVKNKFWKSRLKVSQDPCVGFPPYALAQQCCQTPLNQYSHSQLPHHVKFYFRLTLCVQ